MRTVKLVSAALVISWLGILSAFPQSTVLQGGPSTAGHVPDYVTTGTGGQTVVMDGGPAAGGGVGVGIGEMNIQARGTGTAPYNGQGTGPLGTIDCRYDAPNNNPTGYHYLCFSPYAGSGGLIAYGAGGAATPLPLFVTVNGNTYQFPFTLSGVVGPSTSVINDAACWNNTVGTLLKDCGTFVTVGGTNAWTGPNSWSGLSNFTGTFQINSATQTFPGSGNIVGTSDVQTLTNKSINASEVNSGSLPGTVMPALTGDVTSSAGTVATTISAGVVTNAKLAVAGSANTVKGAATSTAIADLAMPGCSSASSALIWTTGTGFGCNTITANSAGWGLTLSGGTFSVSTTQPPYGYTVPVNLGLTASVSLSALTINVVGANGSAPSSSNPVSVPFRSTTLATGTPNWAVITSAISVTIPSSATLGTSNSTPFRIWVMLEYNAGTPEVVVAVCSSTTQIYPCASWETIQKTTTTISSGATASGVPYAPTGVSNDAIRIIGYADYASGLGTVGTWSSPPTTLQLLGPGMKKPGDMIQAIYNSTTSQGTNTSSTYAFLSSGQSQAISPSSSINLIRASLVGSGGIASGSAFVQLARGASCAGASLIGTPVNIQPAATTAGTGVAIITYDAPATTSSTLYCVFGKNATSTLDYPLSNTTGSTMELQEIMGSLEPINDNTAMRAVG